MIINVTHSLLLTPAQMADADRSASEAGIDSYSLMDRAGQAVAASALRLFPQALRFAVLCGPGNNGGDGYVAARALSLNGAPISLFCLGDPDRLTGDARTAFDKRPADPQPLDEYQPQPGDVVIDAIFGAGLTRDIPLELENSINRVKDAGVHVLSIDLPSGLCGRRGQQLGGSFTADHTVTFMTRKPGHVLFPGRELCGTVEVFDIGIPHRILRNCAGTIAINDPASWKAAITVAKGDTHKYRRGQLTVFSGGPLSTAAARMAAQAALKAGAGLVTIACPKSSTGLNAATTTAVMVTEIDTTDALMQWLTDERHGTFVLGPGFGVGEKARQFTALLSAQKLVLDADAITSFMQDPEALFRLFRAGETRLVLTPHAGEFARLFPDLAQDRALGKLEKAIAAAARANAIVIYKGADSVIAAPDGRALVNINAPPSLATAGSGDTLAGIVGALLAQGMPAFEAAAASVWMHAQTALRLGNGLTADELSQAVMPVAAELDAWVPRRL